MAAKYDFKTAPAVQLLFLHNFINNPCSPKGRVDVVMRIAKTLYVIELKLDKSADSAMAQINLKNYSERFSLSGLPVVKVGINFDSESHTLGDWMIEG